MGSSASHDDQAATPGDLLPAGADASGRSPATHLPRPAAGTRMTLKGAGTYDAAMYCAAIAAAKRQLQAEAKSAHA